MRAYFSVIVDAFQAAMASRVLWLLLFVITAILLALAPFGSHRVLSTQLTLSDIRDPFGLGRQLYKEFNHRSPSPGKRIWQKLDPDMQRALREVVEGDQTELRELSNRVFDLQVALNNLLDDPDLYHVTSWANVALSEEAQALMDRGNANLSEDEVRRLNRLLIEAAYPNLIAVSPPTSVQFSYAKWKVFSPFPLDEETFSQYLRWALSTFMGFFVGTFAVLLAILVTAPIVPQMLETGGIELLLSKPISRWLLFLAKFFGGCIFILLNTVYLVVGLWLIVGWRFGVWEHRMLLCIPIFMFLFMIYYSVSVLAGLVWRSAIMCVFATVLFWAVCFLVGAGKKTIERLEIAPSTIVRLIPAGDTLIAVNQRLQVQAYENGASQWEQLYQPDAGPMLAHGPFARRRRQPRMMGPIYRAGQQQLISAVRPADFRGGTRDGVFLHGAQADNGWSQVPVAELPAGAMWLGASSSGDITVVGRGGVYRIDGDQIRVIGRTVDDALFDELPSLDRVYQADSLKLWSPTSVAKDPSSDSLVVRTAVGLSILRADDAGFYKEIAQRVLESNDDAIAIGYAADTIVTAGAAGQLRTYDSKTLEPEQGMGMGMGVGVGVSGELITEPNSSPRAIQVAPNGQWVAILYHNGFCWLYDNQEKTVQRPRFKGQGDISAVQFTSDRLIVSDRANRISWYDVNSNRLEKRFAPNLTLLEKVYRYIAVPIYTVFPRPGELDNTVHYVLTDRRTLGPGENRRSPEEDRREMDPWRPVTNSLAFTIGMLFLGGWYLHRKEF